MSGELQALFYKKCQIYSGIISISDFVCKLDFKSDRNI